MKKHMILLSTSILFIGLFSFQGRVVGQDLASPTTDLILFFSNIDQPPINNPTPDTLIITERSGPVVFSTGVDESGIVGKVETDRDPQVAVATAVNTIKLLSLAEFTISGTVTFDDPEKSTLKFESIGTGTFEEAPSLINGIPFLRGSYTARITEATGQFSGLAGLLTDNLTLDVSRPGLNNAIGFELMVIRLAPSGF